MAAEIRVVIQDQNVRAGPSLPPEPRSGQPAQPCADDHDVAALRQGRTSEVKSATVAQRMRDFKGSRVTPAQTRLGGRIRGGRACPGKELRRSCAGDDGKRHSIEKIAARYPLHVADPAAVVRYDAPCERRRKRTCNLVTDERGCLVMHGPNR